MARKKQKINQDDCLYFIKLAIFVILGALWLKFSEPVAILGNFYLLGLPLGLIFGLLIASRDKSQIDRRIGYAVLVVMSAVSLFLPVGIIV